MKTEYCRHCGTMKVAYLNGKYDVDTGKPLYTNRCNNPKCKQEGCETFGGHLFNFFRDTCKRCGYTIPAGYL